MQAASRSHPKIIKVKKVRYIGKGEAQHRNHKRLKLGGDHVYGCSSV
jgi:hypothetical protein